MYGKLQQGLIVRVSDSRSCGAVHACWHCGGHFGLATNYRYRQGDETKEEVCFVDVTVFGRQADTISVYLHKGSPALIEGRLRWRSWETNDGQRRSKHEVVADTVHFLPRRDDHPTDADEVFFGDDANMPFVQFGGKKSAPDLDEDIPF